MNKNTPDIYCKKFSDEHAKTLSEKDLKEALKYMSYLESLYNHFLGLIKAFEDDAKAPSPAEHIRENVKDDFSYFAAY